MRQNRAEANDASGPIYRGGLHRCDFMLTQSFAHNIQSARQWSVAKGPFRSTGLTRPDGPDQGLSRIDELRLTFGQGCSDYADGITGALHGCSPPRGGRN